MTIAEVSKKFGLTADTLRYYERIGLIPPVKRSSSVSVLTMRPTVIGSNLSNVCVVLVYRLKC